jgi:hypothetical protein
MDRPDLGSWVTSWAAIYEGADDEDRRLRRYVGCSHLDQAAVADLVDWKFQTWPARRVRTHKLLERENTERVADLTGRAFACNDDLGALLLVAELSGVGAALGSSLLMAHDPRRYTVIDVRALRSLRELGLLPPGGHDATTQDWLTYLDACRALERESGSSLRDVDRALYRAAGCPSLAPQR